MKPLMYNKKTGNEANLSVVEKDEVVCEPSVVSNLINQYHEYHVSATEAIGQPDYIDEGASIEDISQTNTRHETMRA